MRRMSLDMQGFVATVLFISAVLILGIGWTWYRAGVQQAVYEREGVHLTQWEVFVGAKPAERTINLK